MKLLADRFLEQNGSWIDLASAQHVRVRVHHAGRPRAQIAWAESCAMLSRLRHPVLNALLDYGAASVSELFEAFALGGPIRATSTQASHLVTHACRFLRAHGIELTASLAGPLFRPLRAGPFSRGRRPIGVVLQPRRACDALRELLGASLPGGATVAHVCGPPGAGLRTLQTLVAQAARCEGFVPVCAEAIWRWPELIDVLMERHVCLITNEPDDGAARGAVAALLARLGLCSARSHVCLVIDRTRTPPRGAIPLDPMGTTAMTTMIYCDPDDGPEGAAVFEAARRAGGVPARFLEELGLHAHKSASAALTVHESPPAYADARAPGDQPVRAARSRLSGVLAHARPRAEFLTRRGRHAAAARLLRRGARVFEGRGAAEEAGACWLQLGWAARHRGATADALRCCERVRAVDTRPEGQIAAAHLAAVCWTDDLRLVEAEASLRSLVVAASALHHHPLHDACVLALCRTLYHEDRLEDATAAAEPLARSRDVRIACRATLLLSHLHTRCGDLVEGLEHARRGVRQAAELQDLLVRAAASRAMAAALCAARDLDGVRHHVKAGIGFAGAAHLPLPALRLRALLYEALRMGGGAPEECARLRVALLRAVRCSLPPLLRRTLGRACTDCRESGGVRRTGSPRHAGPVPASPSGFGAASALLEEFLQLAQRAPDDGEAVGGVVKAVWERLGCAAVVLVAPDGHVVAAAGKPWRDRCAPALEAIASGRSVLPAPEQGPAEMAEPVRCGGELLGAFACRWLAGTLEPPRVAHAALRAAALAAATHLRGILEAVQPHAHAPQPGWGDLLGESSAAALLRESISRAARAPFPVLIEGESGSGKEVVARAIHRCSPRHTRRFCAINCAALGDELVEAELFGHTRGAFTGATAERAGLFEEADGGTLFLDEVGELSARAQAKLLRVLQEGEVRRVGENLPRRVDVRIVAASNRRLEQEAARGRFRADLRFRLDVLRIVVPPLRERTTDIPVLAQHFWRRAAEHVGSQATLGPEALAALARYDWPGNVRELQNAIAWIAVHAPRRGRVSAGMLPAQLASSPLATGSFEAAREEFERRFLRAALTQAGGRRQLAAKAIGVSRQGLAKMLRRLRIEADEEPLQGAGP